MNFDTYFEHLVRREGEWLRPAKADIKARWPQIAPELERAALALYEEVFSKPSDDMLAGIDEWFYRVKRRPRPPAAHRLDVHTGGRPQYSRDIRAICRRRAG